MTYGTWADFMTSLPRPDNPWRKYIVVAVQILTLHQQFIINLILQLISSDLQIITEIQNEMTFSACCSRSRIPRIIIIFIFIRQQWN